MLVKLKTMPFISILEKKKHILERQHTGDSIFHLTVTHFTCAVEQNIT